MGKCHPESVSNRGVFQDFTSPPWRRDPQHPPSRAAPVPVRGVLPIEVNGLVFQPGIRAPRIQNAFLGVQEPIHGWISLEADAIASRGRRLITTDIINRAILIAAEPWIIRTGYFNPSFERPRLSRHPGDVTVCRVQHHGAIPPRRTLLAQASYTWSHSEDNQSDPLANTFFALNQFASQQSASPFSSAFAQQFNSSGDWANSDFDQRHNFVFYAVWTPAPPPGPRWLNVTLRDWAISGLAAARSGLPFSVYAMQQSGFSART